MTRRWIVLAGVAAVALVAAAYAVGRVTAPIHDRGWVQGNAVGYESGVAAGRALQIGDPLAPGDRDVSQKAFRAGYRAAQADAYGSYDGGWSIGQPYIVILARGLGGAPYRIDQRELLVPGTTYVLCSGGRAVCHQ
jgi:hypothetical protein